MCIDEGAIVDTFDPVVYINEPRWRHSSLGLDRMRELLSRLGNPQDRLRCVHVAGTNGKGSVCAYVSSVLVEAGYKTGLFTSPYIERFEERIRINGENIALDELREVTLVVREAAEAMDDHPTEFELMFAVAAMHFARQACEIVVLEVGLGGRLDATNVIAAPEACVITRLGLDHVDLLGSTIEAIAHEKAGIIKDGAPVVSWPQEPAAMRVIEGIAEERSTCVSVADFSQLSVEPLRVDLGSAALPMRRFSYGGQRFETKLLASYQPSNAALAIEALHALRMRGWVISDEALTCGIARAAWPGRFEVTETNPLVIIDGGHNLQGAEALADSLRELLPGVRPVFVAGILADKEYPAMLREILPLAGALVAVTPDSPRALHAADLAQCAREQGFAGEIYVAEGFEDAVSHARKLAGEQGVICAFGSLYSIASLKAALHTTSADV